MDNTYKKGSEQKDVHGKTAPQTIDPKKEKKESETTTKEYSRRSSDTQSHDPPINKRVQ